MKFSENIYSLEDVELEMEALTSKKIPVNSKPVNVSEKDFDDLETSEASAKNLQVSGKNNLQPNEDNSYSSTLKYEDSQEIRPHRKLKIWSFLLPKKYREALIGDLWELTEDMQEAGCSPKWIYMVTIWHLSLGVLSSVRLKLKERLELESRLESETSS
ncbi:MAG: hypothetical protein AAFY45_06445 [Bacteroidota bacterium]